jgi:hypothetical protein
MRVLVAGAFSVGLAIGCAGRHVVSTAPPVIIPPVTEVRDVELASLGPGDGHEGSPADPMPSSDVFRAQIAPLLAQKCAPCHNPGGKMYATMPFDEPKTITSHAEGVLRRIKAPEEHALIEQWIASQPKS